MKLPNIQVLRACAALMIVVDHCGIESGRLSIAAGGSKLFNESAWGSGVPIFFAISGFIMVVTSAREFGSASAATNFMRRRIVRIVPLYWLVTTAALAAAVVAPNLMKGSAGNYFYVISSYLFWPAQRLTGDIRPLATPGWTLNLEMLFYIVFAVCLLFPRRAGLRLLFLSLGLLVAARVTGMLPGIALNFWGDPIVLGFLLGAAVGIAFCNGLRLSRGYSAALAVLGFGIIFAVGTPAGVEDGALPRLATAIPATLILIAFALGPQLDEARRWWLPVLIIGDASYSLYLVQEFVLRLLFLCWHRGPLAMLPLWAFIPIGIACALLVALVTYRCFEKPVTRWLNGKTPTREPAMRGMMPALTVEQASR